MRVMIVDDDPWIADLLKQLVLSLRPAAHVNCFSDVRSAADAWRRSAYRLVLADWNLPDDTGLSLLQTIRKDDLVTPLVMITGRSDRDSVLAIRPLAVSAYITKPFDVPQVLAVLEPLLPPAQSQEASEPAHRALRDYLSELGADDLDLPLLGDIKDKLQEASRGAPADVKELAGEWQQDPALCAYLISAANSPVYLNLGTPCTSLSEALNRLGGRTSMNLAISLALRQTSSASDDPALSAHIRAHLDASERLAERVVDLARQCGLDPATLQVAAMLHRMGELCVLYQAQEWVQSAGKSADGIDEGCLRQAIDDFAKPFAIELKARWGLPMALRELIGAVYLLPQAQVRREQVLMRLASALCNNEPAADIERLRRLAGLG
jgi:HD-like signal output (HDOD) protein/ActR/RegA family two-component response regulator